MPLYEYKCKSCGALIEVLQKFSDDPLEIHEKCGGQLERLISPSALQFKGTGWYVTDYARGSGSSAPKNGGGRDSASKGSDSKGSEKKDKPAVSSPAPEKK